MSDFDYQRTMRAVFDAVNADDVADGISRPITFCRAEARRACPTRLRHRLLPVPRRLRAQL